MTLPFERQMRPVFVVRLGGRTRTYLTRHGAWQAYAYSLISAKQERVGCNCEEAEYDYFGHMIAAGSRCAYHGGNVEKLARRAAKLFRRWAKDGAK